MRPMIALAALLVAPSAVAGTPIQSAGNLGLGLGQGSDASGLAVKYFVGTDFAIQGNLGLGSLDPDRGGLGISVDALWEQRPLVEVDPVQVAWNLGAGGHLTSKDRGLGLGAQGVVGIEFNFRPAPIDIVVEYRPELDILENIALELVEFGAHIRVYPF